MLRRAFLTRIILLFAVFDCAHALAAPPLKIRYFNVDRAVETVTHGSISQIADPTARAEALQTARQKIREVAKKIAERDGLQLLEITDVAWARPGYDLTDDVVREYEAANRK